MPYCESGEEKSVPHYVKLQGSACEQLKSSPWIGKDGGGKKSIRMFSGMMGERPAKQKFMSHGE